MNLNSNRKKRQRRLNKKKSSFLSNIIFQKINNHDKSSVVSLIAKCPGKEEDELGEAIIRAWEKETNPCRAILAWNSAKEGPPVGYALLHKLDFDECKRHKHPWMLDHVFVTPHNGYRRKGIATRMISELIETEQQELTCFCKDPDIQSLFIKLGFQMTSLENVCLLFQYP